MSRGGFKITQNREDFEVDDGDKNLPSWLKSFADKMADKTAVEVARERDHSVFDQISSIMGNKINGRFATVESVVQDMQKRTGLAEYLNKLQASAKSNKENNLKAAAQYVLDQQENVPEILKKNPEIKSYIDQAAETAHGQIHTQAIIENLSNLFRREVDYKDLQDKSLENYINGKIQEFRDINQSNDNYSSMAKGVGTESNDADDSFNTDAFHFANPSK